MKWTGKNQQFLDNLEFIRYNTASNKQLKRFGIGEG